MGRTGTSCFVVICDSAFSDKGPLKIAKVYAISKILLQRDKSAMFKSQIHEPIIHV
jgi:hypothetical protein